MDQKTKIYIFGAVLVAVIILAIYLSKNSTTTTTGGGSTTTSTGPGGLFGAFGNFVGGGNFASNLSAAGLGSWIGGIFGSKKPDCDPKKPGYNNDGFPSTDCGFGG